MSKWKIHTPEGVQDILIEDTFQKKNMEDGLRRLFRSRGFYEVETPMIEFYDAFSGESDIIPQETMFKFFDSQGRILVLRPDMTIPVARVAATKYRDMGTPLKFSYIGNAYKYNEMGGGKQREYTEAGVEILGVNTPEADAEVIATAIRGVKSTGLESFQIDIGQVEFFKGLMEETGLGAEEAEQLRFLIDQKDFLALEELMKGTELPASLKDLILSIPGLFGSLDVIDRVEKLTTNSRSLAALSNLRQVLQILEDYGLSKYVSVDLGMVQSLNYYTGIIFKGFTYGIGFPIVSGGRYDSLVEKYGRNCPATGFSLGVNLAMMALDRQKIPTAKPVVDTLICYGAGGRKQAFRICEELRNQSLSVDMDLTGQWDEIAGSDGNEMMPEGPVQHAKSRGVGGILHIAGNGVIRVYNVETGEVSTTSIEELLRK